MCRMAARVPSSRGREIPSPTSSLQAAQWSTPWIRSSRGRSGSGRPQAAQASSRGSYPSRHMSFSSKAALTRACGLFSLSRAWREFKIRDRAAGSGRPSTDTVSITYGDPLPDISTVIPSVNGIYDADTAGVTADNVQIDGKAVTVTVPAISILSHEIAQDSISYYDSEDNQFRSIGAELTDFDGFCSDQKSVVENDVYNTDKFSNAEDRLRNVVSAVVKQMGNFDTVTVNFA